MKLIKNKKIPKKALTIILTIVLLFNFVIPNYVQAIDFGGVIFQPISQLILAICDGIIRLLGKEFVGMDDGYSWNLLHGGYKGLDTKKEINYSPGLIFAGKVPMFSIDFIGGDQKKYEEFTISDDYIAFEDRDYCWINTDADELGVYVYGDYAGDTDIVARKAKGFIDKELKRGNGNPLQAGFGFAYFIPWSSCYCICGNEGRWDIVEVHFEIPDKLKIKKEDRYY